MRKRNIFVLCVLISIIASAIYFIHYDNVGKAHVGTKMGGHNTTFAMKYQELHKIYGLKLNSILNHEFY